MPCEDTAVPWEDTALPWEDTALPFPYRKVIDYARERCNYRPINCRKRHCRFLTVGNINSDATGGFDK